MAFHKVRLTCQTLPVCALLVMGCAGPRVGIPTRADRPLAAEFKSSRAFLVADRLVIPVATKAPIGPRDFSSGSYVVSGTAWSGSALWSEWGGQWLNLLIVDLA